jgi:sensor domain CHASE-containing protein
MSLRSKIVLLLLAVVLAYAGLDHLLQRALVYKSFVDLEESVAKKDIQRVNDGIRAEIDRLALDCEGWAGSRDLRRVVSVLDMAAFERVFPEDKFQSDTLHVVCVCDTKGTILHSRVHDGDRHVDVTMKGFAVGDSLVDEALISAAEPKPFAIRGLMDTERSLLLVASHPILPGTGADATGKPIGTLVVGRFLSTVAEAISARVGVGFEAISSSQTSARAGAEEY